jgi:hypothetical protein
VTSTPTDDLADGPLRRLVLFLVLLGAVGLLVELGLLEHFEDAPQWIPLALLGAVVIASLVLLARRTRATVRVFQGIMVLCVVAGIVGVWLHYQGNMEFELEHDSSLAGLQLFWISIRGATPALAPGALSQLGLLGLLYTHRHPALTTSSRG